MISMVTTQAAPVSIAMRLNRRLADIRSWTSHCFPKLIANKTELVPKDNPIRVV